VAVAKVPFAKLPWPVAVAWAPFATLAWPVAVAKVPFAKLPVPVAVAKPPFAVLTRPVAVALEPFAKLLSPIAVAKSPFALALKPTAVAAAPGALAWQAALDSRLVSATLPELHPAKAGAAPIVAATLAAAAKPRSVPPPMALPASSRARRLGRTATSASSKARSAAGRGVPEIENARAIASPPCPLGQQVLDRRKPRTLARHQQRMRGRHRSVVARFHAAVAGLHQSDSTAPRRIFRHCPRRPRCPLAIASLLKLAALLARAAGFYALRHVDRSRCGAPLQLRGDPTRPLNQLLEADLVEGCCASGTRPEPRLARAKGARSAGTRVRAAMRCCCVAPKYAQACIPDISLPGTAPPRNGQFAQVVGIAGTAIRLYLWRRIDEA
jgi:hypothetical protein